MSDIDRLLSRTNKLKTGCWEYEGARDCKGYGRIWYVNNTIMAHRASYLMHVGPITDGLFVLHHCDNPPCVNPEHLFLGTAKDNTHDMMRKGRRPDFKGEDVGKAVLTEDKVRLVRALLIAGKSRQEVADTFKVTLSCIDAIKHGRNWGWLT